MDITMDQHRTVEIAPVESEPAGFVADGIEKSFRRGLWPLGHRQQVLAPAHGWRLYAECPLKPRREEP